MRVITWLRLRLFRHEHGQDLVEYVMLMALIAVVAVLAIQFLGGMINETLYNRFVSQFNFL